MNDDFEQVLDDCLAQITSGASSLGECLARYPEHSAQLKPLLQAASRLERGRSVRPSPEFKARARVQLTSYMEAHPRRKKPTLAPAWRVAASLAALALAFLLTGTAFAQSALPGQFLYGWKLSSEQAWRSVASDPVAVDLRLADRRADELRDVAPDAGRKAVALDGYQEVLARLEAESDARNAGRIMQKLKSHQELLSASGITIPELNVYLSPSSSTSVPGADSSVPSDLSSDASSTPVPQVVPGILPGATSVPAPAPQEVPGIIPDIIAATIVPNLK